MPIVDTLPNGFYPLQIAGALEIMQKRSHVIADQPGSGKTLQAMLGLELSGYLTNETVTLIATTKTACQLTWAPEIKRRIQTQYDVVLADTTSINGTLAMRNKLIQRKVIEARNAGLPLIILANFEALRWPKTGTPKVTVFWDLEFDAVILDEAHLVLPTENDNPTKMTQFWRGLSRLRIHRGGIRLPMTGTPDRGKLQNRYGTWKFLYPEGYNNYWGWLRSQFHTHVGDYNEVIVGKVRDPLAWAAFDKAHMTRRTKREMVAHLPDKQWAGEGAIVLPLAAGNRAQYDRVELDTQKAIEAADAQLNAKEIDPEEHQRLVQGARMRFVTQSQQLATCTHQYTETTDPQTGRKRMKGTPLVRGRDFSSKLDWIAGWLEDRGYNDPDVENGKVVITSKYTEILGWLLEELTALGFTAKIMSGDTSLAGKQEVEAEFQRGDLDIVLLSVHLGVSINLDAADDMIFVDLPHDPDKVEQAEDRIHRASRIHICTYWRLVSEDTIDEVILGEVDRRFRVTRETYEGARGVDFARNMLRTTPHDED